MATNEILPFAQGVGANVQDQVSYTAEPLRSSGNVAGIARSNVNNKALRQASVIASGLAQFMADRQANNITDSATPANISAWMALAVQSLSSPDLLNTTRIDVASAATINLTASAPNTRNINITGTTTITGFTVAVGQLYFVRFAAALTLTNNASIVTNRSADIGAQAGDTCIIRATAANVVEVLSYVEAANNTASLSVNGYQKLPSGLIIQWGTTNISFAGTGTLSAPVTYPITFKNYPLNTWASPVSSFAGGAWFAVSHVASGSSGGVNYCYSSGFAGVVPVRWVAIGF